MPIEPILKAIGAPWPVYVVVLLTAAVLTATPPGRRFVERVLTWCAVNIRFRLRALRRYRDEVLRVDSEVPLPFVAHGEHPVKLTQLYVGRSVADRSTRPRVKRSDEEAAEPEPDSMERRLSTSDRRKAAVITGEPGSGKSLLLQALVYGWANRFSEVSSEPIPIRISLPDLRPELRPEKPHPLDEDGELYPLRQLIARSFQLRGVSHAMRFVLHSLRSGRLWLLLDGLDEVSKTNEDEVRRLLVLARERYPRCRFTVTCREAVYRQRLAGYDTLSLGGFTESNIDEFLERWSERPDGSPEQVRRLKADLNAGVDRLKQLAQSPLLLTYMAYVYGRTDVDRPLPGSRGRFFEEVVDFLLTHKAGDEFSAESKSLALRQLALRALRAERQVLSHEQVIAEIRATLPQAGLPEDVATSLLREIVHRTGLLRKLHARNEYQFAHLNLQEFFAATTFGEHPTELLSHYRSDPDTWREVVRLWCGQASASVPSIVDILQQSDFALALDCLAESDGDYIPDWLTERVMQTFRVFTPDGLALLPSAQDEGRVMSAISSLAADSRSLGTRVRQLLMDGSDGDPQLNDASMMHVLAMSGHEDAADHLLRRMRNASNDEGGIQPIWFFRLMGDTAVKALWNLHTPPWSQSMNPGPVASDFGYPETGFEAELVSDIALIASPLALQRLTELLSDPRSEVCVTAALKLAQLVAMPGHEAVLRRISFPEPTELDLPWRPFEAGCSADFVRLMNRIVAILAGFHPTRADYPINLEDLQIDNRIATYLVAEAAMAGIQRVEALPIANALEYYPAATDTDLRDTAGAAGHRSNTPVENLSPDRAEVVLLELVTASGGIDRDERGKRPVGMAAWFQVLRDSISDTALAGVLSMAKGRPYHDLDVDWVPVTRLEPDAKPSSPMRHLQWAFMATFSVAATVVFLTLAPAESWHPLWFPIFAACVAVGGTASLVIRSATAIGVAVVLLVGVAAIPMLVVGGAQLVDWFGRTLGLLGAIVVLIGLGFVSLYLLGGLSDRAYRRYPGLAALPLAPWAGLVVYRLFAEDWGPAWLQWLAGAGAVTYLLYCFEAVGRVLVLYRSFIGAFLPVTALSWIGLENRFDALPATLLSVGGYAFAATVTIVIDRYLLRRENPLRGTLAELTKRNDEISQQRQSRFGDWAHPDVLGKFKLHSPIA
ncbi:NACHT domain-containing protein [Stackebrandtia nassauensis]|uniref:Putative signal transduction protein with Nacht domain n=1 Tax=Stackebrandtia nassauensis (strain DSM 44728 / CIP 108903 / NRRL B-16338 / NBRC 102104 / LLR-40K-21) TaxID=446470 RepID=D3Q635_STANL|nr:NACHT domain-containing protein [Stackebrandtia nassauensis]ADD42210.1 putative signal transduction protein with Nacht domain [Stackebrandtia nassauensis DSM 44728]